MQKVFDVDNKEDVDLLWSILPDEIVKLTSTSIKEACYGWFADCGNISISLININLHNKTEITRPVNYEDMIGCVCWFWDNETAKDLGILREIINDDDFPYRSEAQIYYKHFAPAKKSELKFYGE